MATLFIAIVLVYILLFQIKWTSIDAQITPASWAIQISIQSWDQEQLLTPVDQGLQALPNSWATQSWINTVTGISILYNTGTDLSQVPVSTGSNITILSGTNVYYGSIESIDKLGIKYQYALVDSKNIYYINLGNPVYDFASIARKLWGNLYEVKTEQDLAQNKLFGTKVTFINLPEYKDKRVLMLIYIKDQTWLVQMDYNLYHKTKAYLKSLFTQ